MSLFGSASFPSAAALFLAPLSPASTFNVGQIPSIFKPESTLEDATRTISHFTLIITSFIFAIVTWLLVYVIAKFRRTSMRDDYEPPQVYGSNRVELAWTVIPVLIVLVLFLASSRVIHSVQDAPKPPGTVLFTAVGHQFWREYRHPALGVVTANELHGPVSDPSHPPPTLSDASLGRLGRTIL